MKIDPLLQRYLDTLKYERKLSSRTLEAYSFDLKRLQNFAASTPLIALSPQQLRLFVGCLHGQGLASSSIAPILSAWRGFYSWLSQQDLGMMANPTMGLRAPRHAQRLPKALSVEHAVALAEYTGDGVIGLRDHVICELFYSSGLRLAELVQLDWRYFCTPDYESTSWLDLAAAQVTVTGKGSKRRTVPVGSHACAALDAWLKVRTQSAKNAPDPHALFLSPRGGRIHPQMVYLRIKALALAAGIPANIHPHVLRHSFASHLLQSSGNLRAVQNLLGHASIASTQIYTALDFQHLAQAYDAAHPRAKRKNESNN